MLGASSGFAALKQGNKRLPTPEKYLWVRGVGRRFSYWEIPNTAADSKQYNTERYNLDAVISAGYRVNSLRATQFRQWATVILRDFAIKGYVLDHKRMENGSFLGEGYFFLESLSSATSAVLCRTLSMRPYSAASSAVM